MPGLHADAEVLYSAGHVPHLYASSEDDLFFAQGWLTASERLWQMDVLRRTAQGRLAEIFGDRKVPWPGAPAAGAPLRCRTMVDVDRLLRIAALGSAARTARQVLDPETTRVLDRYAAGVNARIESETLPSEFRLLRYRPEPWSTHDSLCVQKVFAFELVPSWRTNLVVEALRGAPDDPRRLRALLGSAPAAGGPPLPEAAQLAAFAAAADAEAALGCTRATSNAWVIGPAHSASRAALLCNDPLLPLSAPGPFLLAHLACERYDVVGATLPGLPGVLIGHNRHIAWGLSPAVAPDAELYVEELDAQGRYRAADEWHPLAIEREVIHVHGSRTPAIREVRRTRHGGLLTDLLDRTHDATRGLALHWAGAEPSRDMEALLGVNRASDWPSFRSALRHHGAPAMQVCYADREGHIGCQMAGLLPRERGADAPALRSGATDGGWGGYMPWDDLPTLFDPPDGLVTGANQVANVHAPWPGAPAEASWRDLRIRSMLGSARRHTTEEMMSVQLDLYSGRAAWLTEALLVPLAARDSGVDLTPRAKEMLARILAWDSVARPESDGAACFYLFHDALVRIVLEEVLGAEPLRGWLGLLDPSSLPLEQLLTDHESSRLGPDNLRAACGRALDHAAGRIVDRLGANPAGWRWGALHRLRLRHRLDGWRHLAPLRQLLSPRPIETGGDGMTANGGHFVRGTPFEHRVGAVYRQIFDLADWDRARVVTCGGQSGDPLSRHYRDHLPLWAAGDYLELPFTRPAVERAAARYGRLLLGAADAP